VKATRRPRPAPTTTATAAPITTTTTAAARVQAAAIGPVVWPAAGALTGWFMERRGGSRHTGIDIDGSTGDPVWAAAAGTVAWAGGAPAGYSGYGVVVIVDHGGGLQSVYAHLSAVNAAVGRAVGPGDRIGSVGSTGHSTGSHLHFELRRDGAPVDPLRWLPPR
jgi:murein DD-endopeptidase MepM/ murein hydrolase activator NlpD